MFFFLVRHIISHCADSNGGCCSPDSQLGDSAGDCGVSAAPLPPLLQLPGTEEGTSRTQTTTSAGELAAAGSQEATPDTL